MAIPTFTAGQILTADALNNALSDTAFEAVGTVTTSENTFSEPQTFGAAINQPASAGTNNQTPLLNASDVFSDFIASGIQWTLPSPASLTSTMSAGVAYLNGQRTIVPGVSSYAFPASSDTYVSINNSGAVDYQSVANGATSPTPNSGYVQTAKIVTRPIQSPTPTLTGGTSGSLTAGTYGVALVAYDATGYGAVGASGTVTVAASGSIDISWDNPLNETSMDIYATTAGGTTLGLVASGVTGNSYTYTGSTAPGAAAPTAATSNAIQYIESLLPLGAGYQPRITGSKKRSVIGRLSQSASVLDFGVDLTGQHDSTTEMQNAINQLQGSGVLLDLLSGFIVVSDTLNVTNTIYMKGRGANYNGNNTDPYGSSGSILWFAHPNVGINISGGSASGSKLSGFGTFRNQPGYSVDWEPNDNGYDIYLDNVYDTYINYLLMINPTLGIQSIGSGRTNISNIRMNAFQNGIYIDNAEDVCIIREIHVWPFWGYSASPYTAVSNYIVQNLDAIQLFRCDNPQINNLFTLNARSGIRISQSSYGTTNKIHLVNGDFDVGNMGIWIDDTVTDGVTGQFSNVTAQGWNGANGLSITGPFLQVDGENCNITFGELAVTDYQLSAVNVTGAANNILLNSPELLNLNLSNTAGTPPINITSDSSYVRIAGTPNIIMNGDSSFGANFFYGSNVVANKNQVGSFNNVTGNFTGTLPFHAFGQAIQVADGAKITLPDTPLIGGILYFYSSSLTNYSIIANGGQFIYCPQIGLNSTSGGTVLNVNGGFSVVLVCRGAEFDVIGGSILGQQQAPTTYSGTTSGTVSLYMPQQGNGKEVILTFDAYENDTTTAQTIDFPTPFAVAPLVLGNNTGLTITASTTGVTITAPDNTTTYSGTVVIMGN